jgi:hypothetical protein
LSSGKTEIRHLFLNKVAFLFPRLFFAAFARSKRGAKLCGGADRTPIKAFTPRGDSLFTSIPENSQELTAWESAAAQCG